MFYQRTVGTSQQGRNDKVMHQNRQNPTEPQHIYVLITSSFNKLTRVYKNLLNSNITTCHIAIMEKAKKKNRNRRTGNIKRAVVLERTAILTHPQTKNQLQYPKNIRTHFSWYHQLVCSCQTGLELQFTVRVIYVLQSVSPADLSSALLDKISPFAVRRMI